jgi:predicted dehydrogenase
MGRKLLMGMVGGGEDSPAGKIHRAAAKATGRISLVCGAFSRASARSLQFGEAALPPKGRTYGSYREMFKKEAKLPEGERMDFVSILTTNNMHYPVSMAAADAGFHIACERPMTTSMDEAVNLSRKLKQTERLFCLAHSYAFTPALREAAKLIASGHIGSVRRIMIEYPQAWLATRMETAGSKQAAWRTDPKRMGRAGSAADVGADCEFIASMLIGSPVTELSADLTNFIKGRTLDDDACTLVRFENGARGTIWTSQIAVGEDNALSVRVYGDQGALVWRQREPFTLTIKSIEGKIKTSKHEQTLNKFSLRTCKAAIPLPPSQGFLDSFVDLYDSFANALEDAESGKKIAEQKYGYPTVEDGIRCMAFIEAVARSSKSESKWTPLEIETT